MLSLLLAAASAQSQYRPGGGPSGSGGFGGSSGGFGGDYDAGASDFGAGGGGGGSDLEENIPGVPGDDYPIFAEVPDTSFTCDGQVEGGYYADPEAECQVFHVCARGGHSGLAKYSFLCPNGTVFQQRYLTCDWWFNVDCSLAEAQYSVNLDTAAAREAAGPAEAGGRGKPGHSGGHQGEGRGEAGGGGAGGQDSASQGRSGSGSATTSSAGSRSGQAEYGSRSSPSAHRVRGSSSGRRPAPTRGHHGPRTGQSSSPSPGLSRDYEAVGSPGFGGQGAFGPDGYFTPNNDAGDSLASYNRNAR